MSTVIRFAGDHGPDGPRFVEVERDGKSIRFGAWERGGDGDWLLVLPEPKTDLAEAEELMRRRDHGALAGECSRMATLSGLADLVPGLVADVRRLSGQG